MHTSQAQRAHYPGSKEALPSCTLDGTHHPRGQWLLRKERLQVLFRRHVDHKQEGPCSAALHDLRARTLWSVMDNRESTSFQSRVCIFSTLDI